MFFSHPAAVPTARGRATKEREPPSMMQPHELRPELSNLMNQVLAIERSGPLRTRDFVLCTTNLRSWSAAGQGPAPYALGGKTGSLAFFRPELSNLMNQVLAIERSGPLRARDFVLRTTNLRSWSAAGQGPAPYALMGKSEALHFFARSSRT